MSHSAFRRAGFVARCLSFLLLAFASVAVQAQYTPPYLSTPGTLATFVEDAAAQPVAPGADVAGTSAPLVEVRVSIFPFDAVHDLLAFTPGGASGDIYASFDTGNGRMTLRSTGGAATDAEWTAALRTVTYRNSHQNPGYGTRGYSFLAIAANDMNAGTARAGLRAGR